MKKLLAGLLLVGVAFLGGAQAQEAKSGVKVVKDLVYGKGGDAELKLNLAMPESGTVPFPGVVCIHGGGWRGGNARTWTSSPSFWPSAASSPLPSLTA